MKSYSAKGDKNLLTVDKADQFTEWMYEQIGPYLKGSILEVGSGRGTYSRKIVTEFPKSKIILSDVDKKYVAQLSHEFKNNRRVAVRKIELGDSNDLAGIRVKTCFALNVLEHVEKDVKALKDIHKMLLPGGSFVVLVPAHPTLFNCLDEVAGHHRRYTKNELTTKAEKAGFKVERIWYFNATSILGWFVHGTILKRELINDETIGLFNKLVPMIRFTENKILRNTLGISLIAVLRK
ncbi:MAG: class I SAM-dependent methyltransferase [Candidatus Woesearchaeota archaeon]